MAVSVHIPNGKPTHLTSIFGKDAKSTSPEERIVIQAVEKQSSGGRDYCF
jgi:hypothetical protein